MRMARTKQLPHARHKTDEAGRVSLKYAAFTLGYSGVTLLNWVRLGYIPAARGMGRVPQFCLNDVKTALETEAGREVVRRHGRVRLDFYEEMV